MQYEFQWSVLLEYRHLIIQGLLMTLMITGISLVLSFVLGSIVGAIRHFGNGFARTIAAAFIEFFRNIPPIVQFFFWYFGAGLDSVPAALIGLSIFESAYIAEVVRSGLQSIPKTQIEAARSSGLTFMQMIRHVIFPQGFMRMVPALSIEFINVLKNSSIAMTVGVTELTFQTQEIESLTFRGFEAATAITLIYVGLALLIVIVMHRIERILRLDVRGG